jgi:mannose-6-phosphate isomerase-like protein (cupin superfamily)
MNPLLSCFFTFFLISCTSTKQTSKKENYNRVAETEQAVKAFFSSYGDDLRQHARESIANRYDTAGYYRMGNGLKSFLSFEDSKKRYLTNWTGPKSFDWKDISVEVLSPEAAVVTALFNLQGSTGEKSTYSYTGLLVKKTGGWKIRVEDESFNPAGYYTKPISGNRSAAGPVKYSLTAQPGASIAAHLHSADMHIKVLSGRKYIIIGNLDTSKVQRFDAGSSFVIPANTWHLEWWEEETVEEIDINAPWKTERATPSTPRKWE